MEQEQPAQIFSVRTTANREDQVVEEFVKVFEFVDVLLNGLGLKEYSHRLSLPGKEKDKYAGHKKQWDKAISLIKKALKQKKKQ